MMRLSLIGLMVLLVCPPGYGLTGVRAQAAAVGKPAYVGRFRQHHRESQKIGVGTVVLVAPSWALTAGHVASFKIKNPNGGKSEVLFQGGKLIRTVKEIHKARGVDVALLKLDRPIGKKSVGPAACMTPGFTKQDGRVKFTSVGRSGVHRNRFGKGSGASFSHAADKGGNRPGKAGDSGGAWVIERQGKPDVLFAIIHGGGKGPQVAPLRGWMDKKIKATGQQVTWVAKGQVK
ncbi:MAG: hypothetical protein OSB47_16430 [Pirellulaceae bacterium]|nr:hypothetical protein [Pirellulaceae bacterium]